MKRTNRKLLSLLLVLALCLTLFPAAALAEGETEDPAPAEEPVGAIQESPDEEPPEEEDPSTPPVGSAQDDTGEEPVGDGALDVPEDEDEGRVVEDADPYTGEADPDALAEEPVADEPQEVTASGTCGDNLTWTLEGGTLTIAGTGAMWNWSDDTKVPWYSYREVITDIVLPDGLSTISSYAFSGCEFMTQVTIPESVTSIGFEAFFYCRGLREVVFPVGLTTIGGSAFFACSRLTSVTISESVTNIEDYAFNSCPGLKTVFFLGDAPTFGFYVFSGVRATAYYPAGNDTWTEEVRQDYGGSITWVSYDPEPDHTPGDVNGDGVVNNKDLTRLQRYLKGQAVEVVEAALDVNGDGKINNKDATRLQRYLKSGDVEIH